jgi:anti-sigma B factor antagonist
MPRQSELTLETEREAERTILRVAGELDMATAPRLIAAIDGIIRDGNGTRGNAAGAEVVVDAGGLEFIDSTGLHVLLNAQRRLTRQSRRLRLICAPGPVRRVIDLSRLGETLGLNTTSD